MKIGWYEKIKQKIRFWLLRHLPPCEDTVKVISQSFERKLTLRERFLLRLHLWVCMWCVWYLEHLGLIRQSLRSQPGAQNSVAASPGLSDEARERLKRRLGT